MEEEKVHKLTGVRTVAEYECGSCGKDFEDSGSNSMNGQGYEPAFDGECIDCPHCGEELDIESDE